MTGRKPKREDLRDSILNRILRGLFRPGDRIRESRLATELGASRTPLREALFSLEREGFVRSDPGRGFRVEVLAAKHVREVYPIIACLECLALRTSFPFVLGKIPQLVRINRSLAQAKSARSALRLDSLWHETVVGDCQSKHLMDMIRGLRLFIRRYEHFYMSDMSTIPSSVAQHKRVIVELGKQDAERAVHALEENWKFGMKALLLKLGEH